MGNNIITLDGLYFLGNRNYIQGGTIYEAILPKISQVFSKLVNLDFTYRAIISKDLIFYEKQQNNKEIKVVLTLENENGKYRFYGYHQEDANDIQLRIPYDEEEILRTARINNNGICLKDFKQQISVVRYVIAMNKALLSFLFKDDIKDSKWFLSRLTLNQMIDEGKIKEICLKYCSKFEFQIVKTEIFVNQISVGFIYFSLKGSNYVS
ncbi:hypothetical protein [Helicobacter sp. MIT 05-5294]|uniref:hypothetical protein n=1 Tax=Helicobacter sp. MIT 05-5294 TaxID=1548150 RepID=UPI00051FE141|nr:hypothetical protein [Helicobacter sp. MIT 05-5294]TLD88203.1 hypothetical protein LS69_002815 [Helicobacter sp. MIT 05-5294]